MDVNAKLERLKSDLGGIKSLAVAYSGGTDSTFLLKIAHDVLGNKAMAVTVHSSMLPKREMDEALEFTRLHGIRHILVPVDETAIEGLAQNPPDRCYICKKHVFTEICRIAAENGADYIADGSNTDDDGDYRPGIKALGELGVLSPLKAAGMGKQDIRLLSKEMGLSTWDKPSYACLASRIPYGQLITKEKLSMIEQAEGILFKIGLKQVRVRHHGEIARIEVPPGERSKLFDEDLLDEIDNGLKKLGFTYVALDLKGYRTGSMNETIIKRQ